MANGGRVRVGDLAPDFTLRSSTGELVSLSDFRGKSAVILYFYPRDHSLICTAQACAFRDCHDALRESGAVVIGVSGGSEDSQRQFSEQHELPFHLVSDRDGTLRARYGVPKPLWLLPGRVTYLIDRQGTVRHIFRSQLQGSRHARESLRALHALHA